MISAQQPAHAMISMNNGNCNISNNSFVVSPAASVTDGISVAIVEPMMTISDCCTKLSQIITNSNTNAPLKRSRGVTFAMDVQQQQQQQKSSSNSNKKSKTSGSSSSRSGRKLRKIDELQFAASNVKYDLQRGGLSFPALDLSLRHHIPPPLDDDDNNNKHDNDQYHYQNHRRGVQRVFSKSVSASPFLTAPTPGIISSSIMATMGDLENLFSVTYDSYSKPTPAYEGYSKPSSGCSVSSNSVSTINSGNSSSMCSSESSSSSVVSTILPGRLEDAILQNETKAAAEAAAAVERNATTPKTEAVYAAPISIREAFENASEARLVTLSFAPFLVVHANPAYTQMTGLTSADILGKPFHQVIQDKTRKADTAKAHSLASLNEQVTSFVVNPDTTKKDNNNKSDIASCRVSVAVVGTEATAVRMDKSLITHFLVSLAPEAVAEVATATGSIEATKTADFLEPSKALRTMRVMG